MVDGTDLYALMGAAPTAAPDELRRAYGVRAAVAMSDREQFAALNAAWEVLKDPERRASYDRERAATAHTENKESTRMTAGTTNMTGSTLMGEKTVAATPTMMGFGGERTQAVSLPPCPVCQTLGVPGEAFCVECGFLVGSVAGDEAVNRPLPRLVDTIGREFPLKLGTNTVGREGADVMLPDRTVSRNHARIVVEETGVVWMEDLGSTNGTRFAGAPLPAGRQTSLSDRANIQFGSIKLTVILPAGFERELLALPAPSPESLAAPLPALAAPEGFSAPEASAARLVDAKGKVVPLMAERTTLGRRAGNSILLEGDSFVSGSHAEILYDRDRFLLKDVGSTNGTKLNGTRLLPNVVHPLTDGDVLTFGQSIWTFRAPAASN